MILLVDAGNTRIKFGWTDPRGERRETAALALHHGALEQLPRWLDTLPGQPRAALGVNVAGPAIAAAVEACLRERGCPIDWIRSQAETLGVRNGYRDPAQLGPDRWVSLLALAQRGRQRVAIPAVDEPGANGAPGYPLMLASFGTATTIDTLGPDQVFQGGLIFPGPALMRSSLAQSTANLPEADGDTASYPVHTHQAISTGIAAAQAGAVLRQWLAGLDRYGQPPVLYSAGGGWPMVKEETASLLARCRTRLGLPPASIEWLATPVLDGLARLAAHRTAQP